MVNRRTVLTTTIVLIAALSCLGTRCWAVWLQLPRVREALSFYRQCAEYDRSSCR